MSGPGIRVEVNRPFVVAGPITILDAEWNKHHVAEGRTVEVCRCEHSSKTPLCDENHRRVDLVSRPGFLPEKQEAR